MPVMSGMEFLGAFNALDFGIAERPRVVFCTTENSIDHIRAAIEAGADENVMKPFDLETLEGELPLAGVARENARESCRERGCHAVRIQLVAISYKQQTCEKRETHEI